VVVGFVVVQGTVTGSHILFFEFLM
jgi:hypothetical protein